MLARPGDALCVVRLDRLGRSLRELLETVEELKKRGIAFISLEERIDTSSAAGELVFHVFGAIAHFERRLIGERTRDGLQAAAAMGRRPGRPMLEEEKLSSALALVAAGLSPARTARIMAREFSAELPPPASWTTPRSFILSSFFCDLVSARPVFGQHAEIILRPPEVSDN